MNNYVFFVDFPVMKNNFFFVVEDTVMKPAPVDIKSLKKDEVVCLFRSGDHIKVKENSYPPYRFVLDEVKQYENLTYENCDCEIENLFYHCHNLFEVTVILSGRGYYFVNGKAIEVKAGSIIVFNKLVPHAWIAVEGDAPKQRTFSFYPSLMLEKELSEKKNFYISEYLDKLTEWHSNIKEAKLISDIFDQIYNEYQKKERGYIVYIRNLLINFFVLQSREMHYSGAEKKNKVVTQEMDKAIIYMKSNFQNNIMLEDVAKQVYMHPNYFSSLFKKKYDVSFAHYMNMLKVTMASELMQSTELSVDEIIRQCGFLSKSNFYRVFKEFFKVSPSQYMKNKD